MHAGVRSIPQDLFYNFMQAYEKFNYEDFRQLNKSRTSFYGQLGDW